MRGIPFTEIKRGTGFVHIYSARLHHRSRNRDLLSREELLRADTFSREQDYKRYVSAHAFLRKALCMYTHVDPAQIKIDYSECYGKPVWMNGGLHFNLSYRGSQALLAVSDKPVGADIEKHRRIDDIDGFAKNFFSEKEQGMLNCSMFNPPPLACDPIENCKVQIPDFKTENFFRLWALKEAYIKAIGKGLSHPLQDFSVIPGSKTQNPKLPEDFELELPGAVENKWGLKIIQAPELYSAAVCYSLE